MTIQCETERTGMQRAGRAVAAALAAMREAVVPGITTAELDRIGAAKLEEFGASSAPQRDYGFPGATCISVNDAIVHGVPGPQRVAAGDLVTLDVTAVRDGFVADSAVTVAVPPFSNRQAHLIDGTQRALERALAAVCPGAPVRDVGRAVQEEAARAGLFVLAELTGHGIGRRIHEPPTVPNFPDPLQSDRFHEGLVFALEPVFAERPARIVEDSDAWTLRTHNGAWTAHFEHTVVVTATGFELLTG